MAFIQKEAAHAAPLKSATAAAVAISNGCRAAAKVLPAATANERRPRPFRNLSSNDAANGKAASDKNTAAV